MTLVNICIYCCTSRPHKFNLTGTCSLVGALTPLTCTDSYPFTHAKSCVSLLISQDSEPARVGKGHTPVRGVKTAMDEVRFERSIERLAVPICKRASLP